MDLSWIGPKEVIEALGGAAIAVVGVYLRRSEAASAKRDEEHRARETKRDAAFETLAGKVDGLAQVLSTFQTQTAARFDALQLAVDGHTREIELGRDARGKLHGRLDSHAERLTRAETRIEMHTPVHGVPAVRGGDR